MNNIKDLNLNESDEDEDNDSERNYDTHRGIMNDQDIAFNNAQGNQANDIGDADSNRSD